MAALPWISYLQRMVGRGHPTLADTLNTPLRTVLSQSGYDPDATNVMLPSFSKTVNAGSNAFTGTAEARVTAAVALAVTLGWTWVYVPVKAWDGLAMLPYNASLVTFNTAVMMLREGGDPTQFDVRAWGAAGNAMTDDVVAIRATLAAAGAFGGGTVYFGQGTYSLTTTSSSNFRVPSATATFQPQTQSLAYHFLLAGASGDNIHLLGDGATLLSTVTGGGNIFIGDGIRNFTVWGVNLTGQHTKNADGTPNVAGVNGWAFTSQTRTSYNLRIEQSVLTQIYTGIYIFGDVANPRIQGVDIRDVRHSIGQYTIATHDNGDNVQARAIFCSNVNREYFCYGVALSRVEIIADGGGAAANGFQSLIKTYERDTKDIYYRLLTTKAITGGTTGHVGLESQHSPGVQATPNRLINVTVDIDNSGASNHATVDFQYWRDNTPTANATTNIFDGITLAGISQQAPVINSTQSVAGRTNADKVVLLNGIITTLFNNNGVTGFADDKQLYTTFVPVLRIGGSVTGITYAGSTTGEYWRDGRFLEILYHIVLTSKGVQAGILSLDIPPPFVTANFVVGNPVVTGRGSANMTGLTGAFTGFAQSGGGTLVQIQQQGAAGVTTLTEANITNTSDFTVHVRVPIC